MFRKITQLNEQVIQGQLKDVIRSRIEETLDDI